MSEEPRDSGVSLCSFFARRKLPANSRHACDSFVKAHFSEQSHPAPFQGYCSYTVVVGDGRIVQFRPPDHSLNIDIVATARDIFGDITPETEFLGTLEDGELHVYSMERLPGVSLADLHASSTLVDSKLLRRQVVRDFATLQAMSWKHRTSKERVVEKRLIGSSLMWRLNLMASNIPVRFRKLVSSISQELEDIESLPWALSHGDLIPSNILVCQSTGKILGLLDWAEAEFLPFGVGMYGLEELLGEDSTGRFRYYPEAGQLRKLFWNELLTMIPELLKDSQTLGLVQRAQSLGILLWHAIAFDDGRLDRVVEEGVDDGEIQRLDMFLLHPLGQCRRNTFGQRLRSSFTLAWGLMFGEK